LATGADVAKVEDIKVNIRCNVSCTSFGHSFEKFDATRIFCPKCGEFRTAPQTYFPTWTQPFIWNGTTSTAPHVTVSYGQYGDH